MPFSVLWHTLLDELVDLPESSTLITPLSHNRFRVTDVQEQRLVIEFLDRDIDETRPLQRDQFETLSRRITDEPDGFDRERVLGVDRDKVDDALEVTELSESDVYESNESEYVRKAEVDEERKETHLQGLKNQFVAAESDEAEELREEIEELEDRIAELTEFESGSQFHTRAGGES